jgi:hypothetical protein
MIRAGVRIWLATQPVDMRRAGLRGEMKHHLLSQLPTLMADSRIPQILVRIKLPRFLQNLLH